MKRVLLILFVFLHTVGFAMADFETELEGINQHTISSNIDSEIKEGKVIIGVGRVEQVFSGEEKEYLDEEGIAELLTYSTISINGKELLEVRTTSIVHDKFKLLETIFIKKMQREKELLYNNQFSMNVELYNSIIGSYNLMSISFEDYLKEKNRVEKKYILEELKGRIEIFSEYLKELKDPKLQ